MSSDFRIVLTRQQQGDKATQSLGIHKVFLDQVGKLIGFDPEPMRLTAGSKKALQEQLKRIEMAFLHGTIELDLTDRPSP